MAFTAALTIGWLQILGETHFGHAYDGSMIGFQPLNHIGITFDLVDETVGVWAFAMNNQISNAENIDWWRGRKEFLEPRFDEV